MKKIIIFVFLVFKLFAQHYEIDKDKSELSFDVKHLGDNEIKGSFKDFYSTFNFDLENKSFISFDARIAVSSIDLSNKELYEPILGFGFLNRDKYPFIHFNMISYEPLSGDSGNVRAYLDIAGVKKRIKFMVNLISISEKELVFDVKTTLIRQRFHFAEKISNLVLGKLIKVRAKFYARAI